jgi:hypothetical protein
MKKLFLIFLCASFLFANAPEKVKEESTITETALQIVLVPIFIGAVAYQGIGALIGYPFRVIGREIKEFAKENNQEN